MKKIIGGGGGGLIPRIFQHCKTTFDKCRRRNLSYMNVIQRMQQIILARESVLLAEE